ncbi:nuclear transport factor 2 family protein [Robbsia sp. KACC 23696]|uniref:YybH family protein n=1 Tax=Robbsia sp. KACC 23696 TaxID=3149231 RepID=UPI00325B571E
MQKPFLSATLALILSAGIASTAWAQGHSPAHIHNHAEKGGYRLAQSPTDVAQFTEEYFNNGDFAGLATLYDEDSIFVTPDGVKHRGRTAILAAFKKFREQYSALKGGDMEILSSDTAGLIIVNWRLIGRDGHADASGTGTDVARRRPDGSWAYAVDNPFGVARVAK